MTVPIKCSWRWDLIILTDQKLWKTLNSAFVTFFHYSQYSLKGRSGLAWYCSVQRRVRESFASHCTKESSYKMSGFSWQHKIAPVHLQVCEVKGLLMSAPCVCLSFLWWLSGLRLWVQPWHCALERPVVLKSRLVVKTLLGYKSDALAICAVPVKTLHPSPEGGFLLLGVSI